LPTLSIRKIHETRVQGIDNILEMVDEINKQGACFVDCSPLLSLLEWH